MQKQEIIALFEQACSAMVNTCTKVPESSFYDSIHNKWSAAENLRHLSTSAKLFSRGLSAPKIGLTFRFGHTFRKSISYDDLVKKYVAQQPPAGKITGFEPKFKDDTSKESEINEFEKYNAAIIKSLSGWNEFQLNTYIIPHPLLGKLTLREFLYFMIYHTKLHSAAVEKYFGEK